MNLTDSKIHNNFMNQIINSYVNNEFKTRQELCKHYKITNNTLDRYEKLYKIKLTKNPPENFNTFRESFLNDDQPEKIKNIINEAEKATKNIRDLNGNVVDTEADYNIRLRAANLAMQAIEPKPTEQPTTNNSITINVTKQYANPELDDKKNTKIIDSVVNTIIDDKK